MKLLKISSREEFESTEKKIARFVTTVGMICSVSILMAAVWALWPDYDHVIKLGVLTGFVAFFAIWVGFFMNAGRKEIYTFVAVYATVLVVYVGRG